MAGHMMRIWCLFIAFCQHAAWGQSSYPAFPPGGLPSVAPADYPNYQRADYQSSAIPQPYGPASSMSPNQTPGRYWADDLAGSGHSHSRAGHVSYSQASPDVADPADKRAGLLGSSYLDAQYVFLSAPSDLEYSNSFQGVRGTVNTPILWDPEVQDFFFQDVFVSGRHLGMTTEIPNTFPLAELEADWNSWAIGTTIFADVTPSFRPFIQLGYLRDDIRVQGQSAVVYLEERDSLNSLLLNLGSEFDITDNLGGRITLELDNRDLGDSFFTLEQIYWCTPNVFLRGGLIGDIGGTTIGAVLGGGVSY